MPYCLPGLSRSSLRLSFIVDPQRSQTHTGSVDLPFGSGIGPFMRISRLFDWVQFGQRGLGRSWKRGEEGFSMVTEYTPAGVTRERSLPILRRQGRAGDPFYLRGDPRLSFMVRLQRSHAKTRSGPASGGGASGPRIVTSIP